jgi:hypothetical protein
MALFVYARALVGEAAVMIVIPGLNSLVKLTKLLMG